MRSSKEILQSVVSSSPKITVDAVKTNGDVAFHVMLKDCMLLKEDFTNPITGTMFFSNFLGELFVRGNIQKFATILTGLDPALYQKLICSGRHKDFGMVIDEKWTAMTFQMHLSLVQSILTEDFGRASDFAGEPSVASMFDQSKPESEKPDKEDEDNE